MPSRKSKEPDMQVLYAVIDANLEALAEIDKKIQKRKDREWLASIPITDTEELRKQWNMPRRQAIVAQISPIVSGLESPTTDSIEQSRRKIEAQLQRLAAKLNPTD